MIKILSYPQARDLENEVNKWIQNNKINVKSLEYNTVVTDNELRHNLMIFYECQVSSEENPC